MSSWFGHSGKTTGGNDTNKIDEQQQQQQPNKKQFPVVVELDEQVLLNDFVNPKKAATAAAAAASSSSNASDTKMPLLIGSIDQGTSSTRFLVFCSTSGKICCSAQMEHSQIVFINQDDKVGWHEHDPMEIFSNTMTCIQACQDKLRSCPYASVIFSNVSLSTSSGGDTAAAAAGTGGKNAPILAAVGLTNQRETTIAWNRVRRINSKWDSFIINFEENQK
jgi:FGGY family of carbohydrate kinases, N-terminal domain